MNDERFQRTVGSWLRDEDAAPPDSLQSARQVAARLPQVRQQSRWWPLPLLRRRPAAPHVIPHTDALPRPIPATNGHNPTVLGRTQTMFSPVKAITAGAIVFAIGGAFLIAGPFEQGGGSLPGAVTDSTTVAPVWLTGTEALGAACEDATSVSDDGVVVRTRGWHCDRQTWETSDPRLTGDVTSTWNADVYRREDGENITLAAGTYELGNDGGGWHCEYADALKNSPTEWTDGVNDRTATCIGGDGYDGLTAVLFFRWTGNSTSIEGLVFGGDVPPLPGA
jgi:hypothetical protein